MLKVQTRTHFRSTPEPLPNHSRNHYHFIITTLGNSLSESLGETILVETAH